MHTQRHLQGAEQHTWWLDSDTRWISDIARRASTGTGVLLYGEPGAGQEEIAEQVVRRLGSRNGLLELACPPDEESSEQLTRLLDDPPAAGRVLFIPDLASFEGPEVEQVSRLVVRHGAIVVAGSADPHGDTDAPLSRYLRLERIRVLELSLAHAAEYLQRGLGGPLSERAAYAIWNSGAGNRSMMRMIVDDWVDMGYLLEEESTWVIRSQDFPAGPRLVRHWKQRLARLDPPVRQVFELLALARELPLDIVMEIGGAAVDDVHELGYLHLSDSAGRDASLRGIINSTAIADQVPPARSRELLDRVSEHAESLGIAPPVGLIAWKMRCGVPVQPARLVEGAEHSLQFLTPLRALDLLRMVGPHEVPERAVAVRIGTFLAAGYFLDTGSLAGLLGLGRHVGVAASAAPASSSATETVMELVGATWAGDFLRLLRHPEPPPLPEGLGWLWQELTHEAQVNTGQVRAGLSASRQLLRLLEQQDRASFLVQRSRFGLFDLEMVTGEWAHAIDTLGSGWDSIYTAPGREGSGALYAAIAEAMAGRFEACLDQLRREIPQLKALRRFEILPLAHSLRAFAWSRKGNRLEALRALAHVEQLPVEQDGGIWRIRWTEGFFRSQAMAGAGRLEEAIEWLMSCATRDHELGNASQELMALAAAVQCGHAPALALLGEAAGRADGRFAEACTWVVRGLQSGDPRELEYGALLLGSMGQYLFADYVQERLEDLNGPCPQAGAGELAVPPANEQQYSGGGLTPAAAWALLTPRQRAIVDHVLVDRGNAEIAEELGLSVRTIESHLYQAYAKLNVANRVELRGFLSRE